MRRIILFIIFILFVFLGVYLFLNKTDTQEIIKTPKQDKTETTSEETKISAWIPYWDIERGLKTLEQNPDTFYLVMPVLYEVNEDGSLLKKNTKFTSLQKYAQDNEIAFVPSIAMFDHEIFTKVLQNQESFDRHLKQILDEIDKNNFDGIDLDYESTKLSDKEKYQEFVIKLNKGIREIEKEKGSNLTFSITVLAKWGENTIYPTLKETRQVQDWAFLSKHADEIRIMAYDYSSQAQKTPGPIAPILWVDLVINEAIKKIPKKKIHLGVHNYGYNWAASEINIVTNLMPQAPEEKLQADAYTYDQIKEITEKYNATIEEIPLWGERYASYKRDGNDRILVYIDESDVQKRYQKAKKSNLAGISFWRLGGDLQFDYSIIK